MIFKSTRNPNLSVNSKEALLKGISPEGGLFVPENFPKSGSVSYMIDMEYKDIAYYILGKFLTDFTPEELSYCVNSAYNDKFKTSFIAPLHKADNRYFIELYHGRTSAFKDMALSILPYFMEVSLKQEKSFDEIVILTATSGDTGKAALEGFKDVENIKIAVFFPETGVSATQKSQMQTQEGENVYVLGIHGNFDDCQTAVKNIFANKELADNLDIERIRLSSANSINIGRLIPQIVYYFNSYKLLLKYNEINQDEKINIVVPTGNFGNILAAYYAKMMGLPVNNLICASNENNILTDFINTGIYDANRDLKVTTSPSMDILVSSNLERFLYHISDEDTNLVNDLMENLNKNRYYKLPENLMEKMEFLQGYYATEEEANEKIRTTLKNEDYLIDPHTAVASVCYDKYLSENKDNHKTIIASTASPYKFSSAMLKALNIDDETLDDFEKMEKLYELSNMEIPNNLIDLRDKKVRFTNHADKEDILDNLNKFIKGDLNA